MRPHQVSSYVSVKPRTVKDRVTTSIQQAACAPSAFNELKEVEMLVKPLKSIYHFQLHDGSPRIDGSQTDFMQKVWTAIEPRYDESNKSRPTESVWVCYNGKQYRQVLKDNPHLVDWKSAKPEGVGKDLSENPTVSEPSVAETTDPYYYHSPRGRFGDLMERGTHSFSDPESDGDSNIQEEEEHAKSSRRIRRRRDSD